MIERLSFRYLLVFLSLSVALIFPIARSTGENSAEAKADGPDAARGISFTNPVDGRIAWLTAKMLEQLHYDRQTFDDSVSSKFLDRYLKTLDPQSIHFLRSDLAEFEQYRTRLDNMTAGRRGFGELRPAAEIFNRFVERLRQRVEFAQEMLKTNKFSFEEEARIVINRENMPHPKDLAEAQRLWSERVRYEYLQELMGKIAAKQKSAQDGAATNSTVAVEKKSDAEEIFDTLTHRYQRNLRTFTDFDSDDVLQIYLSALAHVYDPHSDYMGRAMLEGFAIGMNLSLFGIGAELRSDDGYCTINRLLPGGPAIKSGKLKEKDKIIAVAQSNAPPVDVVEMNLSKAVQLIRGPKGTEVKLTIIPAEDPTARRVISLVRDEIPLEDQAAKGKIIETISNDQTLRYGIIDLPSFYTPFNVAESRGKSAPKSTTSDVTRLINKMKKEKVEGIILDLRRNGGGSLEEAIRLTGLFIKQGPIVQVKGADGIEQEEDRDPSVLYEGPLLVLTSRFSASASEILAGALQDYGRAVIVGDAATHGKGTVQSVNQLRPYLQMQSTNDPGALKVTIKKFYRASGASTQLKGVTPDIVLPSVFSESKDFGESAMENPMPWDTIASAKYDYLNRVAPYLRELRDRSTERLAKDPDYLYIKEDIELYKKQQADKTISLNLKERLKEKEELEARIKARDAERLARKESNDTIYEITMKIVDDPGLPEPVRKTNSVPTFTSGSQQGASTNATASATPIHAIPFEDDLDEPKPAAVDAAIAEAQRILLDYIFLLPRSDVAAVRN